MVGKGLGNGFAHTFSIVARCHETGQLGVAVQSHWFSVGSIVIWAEAGVGAVATQAMIEMSYGPLGLALMRAGKSPAETLSALTSVDNEHELRQVAMVDRRGRVAVHTGPRCVADAGHEVGEGFSVQANMMINREVWPAMVTAYRSNKGDLTERLLAALEAGQAAGGDARGQQSAAILVVAAESTGRPWVDRLVDLRVEDHTEPISELRRLVEIGRVYKYMNKGDALLAEGNVEGALEAYRRSAEMEPEIDEFPFWHAVTLADLGRVEEALPIFQKVFLANPNWKVIAQRLPASGMLRDDPEMMQRILAAA
ncbi:MAG: DUF1028 domain-containing protein [Anaerolineales bacterium]|nr:DUF1028 domain-containing protein [Anaerolineales bacterium]